jgi:hypothetical protein
LLGIDYESGQDVALGNFIKPSDAAKTPKVSFIAPDESAQYSLLLVKSKRKAVFFWLVGWSKQLISSIG